MIRVRIDTADYGLSDVTENWINEQVNRRRADNVPVCIHVIIRTSNINMVLSTVGCGSGGEGRPPSAQESEIFKLWDQMHLNNKDFAGGNMVAFLKRVQSYI